MLILLANCADLVNYADHADLSDLADIAECAFAEHPFQADLIDDASWLSWPILLSLLEIEGPRMVLHAH